MPFAKDLQLSGVQAFINLRIIAIFSHALGAQVQDILNIVWTFYFNFMA